MNGLELAQWFEGSDLRIVLATGYSDAAAQATRECPVLRKPYKVEDLDWAFALPAQRNVIAFQDRRERASKNDR